MARAGSLWLKIGDASNSWEQSSISRWRTLLAGLERRRYKKGNKHRGGDYDYCLLDLGTGIQKRSSSFSGGMGGPSQRPWKTVTYNKK